MICKNWKAYIWSITWKFMLGFDRLKTTPDRSSLAAGCTSTLRHIGWLSLVYCQCGNLRVLIVVYQHVKNTKVSAKIVKLQRIFWAKIRIFFSKVSTNCKFCNSSLYRQINFYTNYTKIPLLQTGWNSFCSRVAVETFHVYLFCLQAASEFFVSKFW